MIAIVDYGAGNLFSVKNALDYLKIDCKITNQKNELEKADGIILPGVGAFPDAMKKLDNSGLTAILKEQAKQKPFLGICLGMQMLFEESDEFQLTKGLGLIEGRVERIKTNEKIPHIGFNSLDFLKNSPLLEGLEQDSYVYFVHSYMANTTKENIVAECEYGVKIPALVQKDNIYGAQFHPEKSGEIGLTMLKNFGGLTK